MNWKSWVGIFLMIASLAGFIFWEAKGRNMLLLSSVLVACEDIECGTVVTSAQFEEIKMIPENILQNAVLSKKEIDLDGLVSSCPIAKNQQLCVSYLEKKSETLQHGESIFVLPSFWIYSMSSAVRAGDTVVIYSLPENEYVGEFLVAFVKDKNDQEVRDVAGIQHNFLRRADATAEISHIEIVCKPEEYMKISQIAELAHTGKLLIVLKG